MPFSSLTAIYRTPLHPAIALPKNYDISRVLMENGGDLHNQNADGKTPLHTFPSQVSEQILRCHGYLLDFSACDHRGMSLLHYLAWSSKTSDETFRRHHERGTLSLRTVDTEGRSMLHLAAQRGNVPVVEYLASLAKDFNINQSDNRGRTVLHYGVENKRACDTITALISHGADIWATDCPERSALHHAAKIGNLPAVKALLAFGVEDQLGATDCFGMTTLQIAAYHKAHAVLTFLLETESQWKGGKQSIGPGFIGYRDLSAVETHSFFGTPFSTHEPTRYGALPTRPESSCDRVDQGWMSLSRTMQGHQWQLNNLNTYHCDIKYLALAVLIWMLLIFLN